MYLEAAQLPRAARPVTVTGDSAARLGRDGAPVAGRGTLRGAVDGAHAARGTLCAWRKLRWLDPRILLPGPVGYTWNLVRHQHTFEERMGHQQAKLL